MDNQAVTKIYAPDKKNVLQILHYLQDLNIHHYLTQQDLRWVSEYLGMRLAEVFGIVTYYSMFSLVPRGIHCISVCKSPVCHMMGSKNICTVLENLLSLTIPGITRDMAFSVEFAECLGHCNRSPVIMINKKIYGNLTERKCEKIISDLTKHE